MTGATVTGDVLDRLDFDPVVPCDSPGHEHNLNGCQAEQPGRWVVLVTHWAHDCKPTPLVLCDPGLQASLRGIAALLAPIAGIAWSASLCAVCGTPLHSVDDPITVIREI